MYRGNNISVSLVHHNSRFAITNITSSEYRKYIEKDAAFERRFAQVLVNEPSVPETINILRGIREKYEVHHGVRILDGALISAATLAHRYLTSRRLPDSAIDLVDEACARYDYSLPPLSSVTLTIAPAFASRGKPPQRPSISFSGVNLNWRLKFMPSSVRKIKLRRNDSPRLGRPSQMLRINSSRCSWPTKTRKNVVMRSTKFARRSRSSRPKPKTPSGNTTSRPLRTCATTPCQIS